MKRFPMPSILAAVYVVTAFVFTIPVQADEIRTTGDTAEVLRIRQEACEKDPTKRFDGFNCVSKSGTEDDFAVCKDLNSAARQAEEDMTKSCTEAGMKGSECITKVAKCIKADKDSSDSKSGSGLDMATVNQLLSAAGVGFNIPNPSNNSNSDRCSNMSSRDYFDEKDRIERDLKDLDRESADLTKEIAEEKEKVDDKFKDAQEKIAQSKKDLAEKKLSVKKDQREETSNLQKQQLETSQQIRDLNKKMMERRAQMAQYEIEQGKKMAEKSAELDQLACLAGVKELRDSLIKAGIYTTSGSGVSWAAQADQRKKELQASFDSCIKKKNLERIQLLNEREAAMKLMRNDLSSMQQDIDQANTTLTNLNTNMTETMKDLEQSVTDAQQNVLNEMQNANTSLQAAQQTMQQKQAGLAQKQTSIAQRKSRLQQDLTNLGPEPNRGAKVGWYEASRGVETFINKLGNFQTKCCETAVKDKFKDDKYCKSVKGDVRKDAGARKLKSDIEEYRRGSSGDR